MTRFPLRAVLLLTLTVAVATEGEAQRARRKRPFEDFSKSAQRLRGSVAARMNGTAAPNDSLAEPREFAAPGVFAMVTAQDTLIAAARSQLGTKYVWGAERPGKAFDCSGLMRFVMSALRIDLPRTAREQATQGTHVAKDVRKLRPGDLLTFGKGTVTHIGVYVGDGQFVHASTSQRRVVEASIDQPGTWFRRNWIGVRRLLASAADADSVNQDQD